ncbi:hypothetical protein ABZ845_25900 [Streptomyces sp. NPDC047022]|uniref:hypothetical protein n=1 Tax=Streptomyces sp. NPDC047022 TaxID=3155737 RepID=UPI0034008E6F
MLLRLLRFLPPLPREISYAVVGVLFGLLLAVHGALEGYRETTGVAGSVRVADCTPASGGWDELWADGWACRGSFDSADGTVHIAGVAVDGILESHPGATLAAVVDGPGAATATQDSSGKWKWPALTGLVFLVFAAWKIRNVVVMLRGRRIARNMELAA